MPLSEQSLHFLVENAVQNSRDWFQENKGRYQQLVETPMLALADALHDPLYAIDPHMTLIPKRTLSRIWKDMRYNKGPSIFRDVMWLVFRRGKGMEYPAYYFEFSPQGFRYGVGYFSTPPAVMNLIRQWILTDDKRYLDASRAVSAAPEFRVTGERFKRNRFPDAPAHKQDCLNRKQLIATCERNDMDVLYAEDFSTVLAQAFEALSPIYHMLLAAHLEVLEPGGLPE